MAGSIVVGTDSDEPVIVFHQVDCEHGFHVKA